MPDYYEVIKEPIDLSLIQRRLESHKFYKTIDIFVADVLRMFENAKVRNFVRGCPVVDGAPHWLGTFEPLCFSEKLIDVPRNCHHQHSWCPTDNRPCNPLQTYNSVDTVFHKIATKLMGEFQQWVETTVEWNG